MKTVQVRGLGWKKFIDVSMVALVIRGGWNGKRRCEVKFAIELEEKETGWWRKSIAVAFYRGSIDRVRVCLGVSLSLLTMVGFMYSSKYVLHSRRSQSSVMWPPYMISPNRYRRSSPKMSRRTNQYGDEKIHVESFTWHFGVRFQVVVEHIHGDGQITVVERIVSIPTLRTEFSSKGYRTGLSLVSSPRSFVSPYRSATTAWK